MVAYVRKLASRAGVFHVTATLRYTRSPWQNRGPKEDGFFEPRFFGRPRPGLHAAAGGGGVAVSLPSIVSGRTKTADAVR